MSDTIQRLMNQALAGQLLLACLAAHLHAAPAAIPATPAADRSAVERIYHTHRIGTQKPFEETMPPSFIEQLVQAEKHKEAVLKAVYGVEITAEMVEAEVRRIDTTTRAPETLAEIKQALGSDPERFARTVARPIVVEHCLRRRFDNDDKLHAPQRQAMETLRAELLAAKVQGQPFDALKPFLKERAQAVAFAETIETTWLLTPRPAEATPPGNPALPSTPTKVNARAGVYNIEATAQMAQVLASPREKTKEAEAQENIHFDDLPGELQNVLRAQLRTSGDISAVIETPGGFTLYLAKEKTAETIRVVSVSLRKRDFNQWLTEQKP